MAESAHIVGIAGGSCAGKTVLATQLAAALGDCLVLPVDSYYRDLSGLPGEERAKVNFDAPEAIEYELFEGHLRALAEGHSIERPVYDFATHSRRTETERMEPARYVITEGLFALYWPGPRSLMRLKVFVSAPDEVCLERRTLRDIEERGRTAQSVWMQYRETVGPMYARYCRPTQVYADLVLDGRDAPARLVDLVMDRIRRRP